MDDYIRILVVDDEADIRRIIRILLESRGYRVLEAPNGRLAVETIRKEPDVDLILLDIMMPELSGIEASREIRSISSAPILFLTARTQEQDKLEAYSSGGDDYLAKPFSHGELLMKVDSLLRRYRVYKGKVTGKQLKKRRGARRGEPEDPARRRGLRIDGDGILYFAVSGRPSGKRRFGCADLRGRVA